MPGRIGNFPKENPKKKTSYNTENREDDIMQPLFQEKAAYRGFL